MPIRNPRETINIVSATNVQQNAAQKILFVGQMTSAGTATSGQLYQNISNDNSQDTLFGKNSMLATAIRQAKLYNKVSRIDAIPLDDNVGGTQAQGVITFTAPTPTAGTIEISVESPLFHKYIIPVTSSSTATSLGDALVAAITADDTCPVTANNSSGAVTLTSVNAGTVGNFIGLSINIITTNVTCVITTPMSSGATDPSLTNIFDVIGNNRYQTIVWPSNYSLTPLTNLLDSRWNVDNNILDGVGIITEVDTVANIITDVNALNDQSIVVIANKSITPTSLYSAAMIMEAPLNISSQFAAIRALRLTDGANISSYVISSYGIRDNVGGIAIASLPYFNTPFRYLPIVNDAYDITDIDISNLLNAGASVLGNNIQRTSVIAGQVATTYKYDNASDEDLSFKYLEYVDTISNIREYFFNNLHNRFAQSRLTDGDVQPGRNMANAAIIGSFLDGLYVTLGSPDYVLTRIGIDPTTGINYIDYFKQNRTVTLNLETGAVTIYMQVPIVTQLRSIVAEMQINFSVNS